MKIHNLIKYAQISDYKRFPNPQIPDNALNHLLRKGQNRCTETCPNSIKSCPFKLIARVHTYLFDSLINLIYIDIIILIQCNPYHLANPSSRSKHDIMCVNLLHLSRSLTHMTSCLLHLERKGGHFERFVYNFQYFSLGGKNLPG